MMVIPFGSLLFTSAAEFESWLSEEGAAQISAVIIGLLIGMTSAAKNWIEG